jgi:hypothetical protein
MEPTNDVFKEINKNGIKLLENEKTGEIREPRFEMPIKEAFENDKIRFIKRTGYYQTVLEVYVLDSNHTFLFWRADNDNEQAINVLDFIYKRITVAYNLTLQNLIIGYQEYKVNFSKMVWLQPKD